jgi:hypothetical protein
MIKEIIWLISLPMVIFLCYCLVLVVLKRSEKVKNL